jgi:hypothetical protein
MEMKSDELISQRPIAEVMNERVPSGQREAAYGLPSLHNPTYVWWQFLNGSGRSQIYMGIAAASCSGIRRLI